MKNLENANSDLQEGIGRLRLSLEATEKKATSLEKGCVQIIRQLHPYFEDKSVLLQA